MYNIYLDLITNCLVRNVINKPEEKRITAGLFKRFILYHLQFIFFVSYVGLILALALGPAFCLWYFRDWSWTTALLGPFCVFLIHYLMIINIVFTVGDVSDAVGNHFTPYKCKKMQLILIRQCPMPTMKSSERLSKHSGSTLEV